jgi:hypothetical protein
MARKEIIIDIQDREQFLTFKVKEMPATRLEAWIIRALLLLAGSGAQTPEGSDLKAAGAFLAEKGLSALSGIDYDKARPLLDDLLGCCSRIVEKVEERCTPESVDNYILDVSTLFKLRMEAIKLNLGFLGPEVVRLSGSLEKASTNGQ